MSSFRKTVIRGLAIVEARRRVREIQIARESGTKTWRNWLALLICESRLRRVSGES